MALSSCEVPFIEESSLRDWTVIGAGGFGQVYKARHCEWCCDVAVKLLHYDDGSSESLLRELRMTRQGSNPHVIQVLGIFKGRLPTQGLSTKLGLVMEIMEKGSLASLQAALQGAPPWPLVFRLAHQVARGINFLHTQSPPLLHLDLKPSNVLLDSDLNAKLTDFGLARFYRSVTRGSKKDSEEEGGTISYMPPEAFDLSYSPTRASDIYSYGILLWSIITGKQPYEHAMSSIVRIRIPRGDRPSLDEIRSRAVEGTELEGLMDLMVKCWEKSPQQRPTSFECTTVTEKLYAKHKPAIRAAVCQVLDKLDQREEEGLTEPLQAVHITEASATPQVGAVSCFDDVPTRGPPIQEVAGCWPANQRDNAHVTDEASPQEETVCHTDPSCSTKDDPVKVSSVHPIQSSPPSPSTGRSSRGTSAKPTKLAPMPNLFSQYQRQFSSPGTFQCHPPPRPRGGVHIHLSNVTGFQQGDKNTMHFYATDPTDRKRHPTAPPSVNLPMH